MQIHTLPLGSYQTNTYIVANEDRCAVIDPGFEPETIARFLQQNSLTIDAVFLTHGHFDHVGAVEALADQFGCPVYVHEAELSMPQTWTGGALRHTHTYGEGDRVSAAGLSFRVIHTPGHTPGSVCLILDDHMFSGDTLFAGSCGRTDLPGGDWATLRRSLNRLAQMEDALAIHPGHGESTVLAQEKQYNPYMQ